jgi:hypothetical protein
LNPKNETTMAIKPDNVDCQCNIGRYETLINKINKKIWKRKYELQSKKKDAPKVDEVNSIIMVGKDTNKKYKNKSFAYKVNQAQ